MTDLNVLPANNRMAFVGASTGIPHIVQARLDLAKSRLADISSPDAKASSNLPRFSILFADSVLAGMRKPVSPASQKLSHFFHQLGDLGNQLNIEKLGDCQFLAYDNHNGTIATVPLTNPTATPSEENAANIFEDNAPGENACGALKAHQRIEHIHQQLDDAQHLHHPDLLVSDNDHDVKAALRMGIPAIFVAPESLTQGSDLPAKAPETQQKSCARQTPNTSDAPLMVALDFDCTLAGAEGDWVYHNLVGHQPHKDRKANYTRFEGTRADQLLGAGPALHFTQALVGMKKLLSKVTDSSGNPLSNRLAFALVTARGHATRDRVHTNLSTYLPDYQRTLNLTDVPENSERARQAGPKSPGIFYMNGAAKLPRLHTLAADLYLDDSAKHTQSARSTIPTGEVLWGEGYGGERIFYAHDALTETPSREQQESTHAPAPYVIIPEPLEGHPDSNASATPFENAVQQN